MIVNENNNNHRNCAERHFYYILFKFSIKNSLKNIFVSEYWIKLLRCLHAKTSNMRRLKRMKRREEETGSISTWCKRSRFSNKLMKPKLADATKYSRMYLYTSTCIGWNWGRKLLTSKRAIRKHCFTIKILIRLFYKYGNSFYSDDGWTRMAKLNEKFNKKKRT